MQPYNDYEKDMSSGGIIFYKVEDKKNDYLFLLLKQKNGNYWGLAKGHPEQNETIEEAARREVTEETGILQDQLKLICPLKHQNKYNFLYKGKKKSKTVILFLFQSFSQKITLSEEHLDYKWVCKDKILSQLTHDTLIPAFLEVFNILNLNPE